ncbi:MAG: hypothetical protein RLZZ519_1635 [Bacteroidota bacterium]|jgi:hypothetical protein
MNLQRLGFAALLLLMAVNFQGCCTKAVEYHYKIAEAAYGFLPYDVNSEFRMKHSSGAVDHFTMVEHRDEEFWIENCGDCCMNEFGEYFGFQFEGDSSKQRLRIGLEDDGPETSENTTKVKIITAYRGYFEFGAENDPCPSPSGMLTCIDSLEIQGATYFHVYKLLPHSGSATSGLDSDTVWYNAHDGLLKIRQFNGETWELLP